MARFREAVQQQDQATVRWAGLGDMEPGPVRSHVTVLPGARYLDGIGLSGGFVAGGVFTHA